MRKKLFSLILILTLVFAAAVPGFAGSSELLISPAPVIAPAPSEDIVIVHTNDIHCAYENFGKLATVAKDADLLLDAGDATQGGVIGTLSSGEYIIDIMNFLGYDAMALGNHEFDYKLDGIDKLIKKAEFPVLCCNFADLNGKDFYKPYEVFEVKGKKIAVVSVLTPQTPSIDTPDLFKDENGNSKYDFYGDDNGLKLYEKLQGILDELKPETDCIIALAHLGNANSVPGWNVNNLVANVSGLDAVIDGHSHVAYTTEIKDKDGKLVPVQQTGTALVNAGQIVIKADGRIEAKLVSLADVASDADTDKFIEGIDEKLAVVKDKVIGKTAVDLTINNPDGTRAVRTRETNLADLAADAFRHAGSTEIAVINGGGVRASISAGNITYGQILSVMPFNNSLCIVKATGQQILDALEWGSSDVPDEKGGFLQTSGLEYTINYAIPSDITVDETGAFVKINGQRRVSDVKVNGEPIERERKYSITGTCFTLLECGDGYSMFGSNNLEVVASEIGLDNQALIDFIAKKLGGVVGDEYREVHGNITVINDPSAIEEPAETEYTVVAGDSLWKIAKKLLGNGREWQTIYTANKSIIKNPDLIYEGQVFVIPAV